MDGKCNGWPEGEEGYIFCSPLHANGINSRKRVKLQGKVTDDHCSINTPFVPKRKRSAFNKRDNQSVSSPLSASKREQQHASNGTQLCNYFSAERVEHNMVDSVTKDEEEVAETLAFMANLTTFAKPVQAKGRGKILEENSETKATSSSSLEAPKEDGTKFTVSNPSPCVEEQPTAMSVSQKFDAEANGSSHPNSLKKLSSTEELTEGAAPLRDPITVSNPLGASLQCFPVNGMLQPTQLDSLSAQKQELGPNSMEHDLQSFKRNPDCVALDFRGKAPDGQPGLHSRSCEQWTMLSASKAVTNPCSVTVSRRPCSTDSLPVEKLSPTLADEKRQWKKCVSHVYVARLIQNLQKAGKKQLVMLQCSRSKPGEGANHGVPMSGLSLLEVLEARSQKLQDERLLQAQKGCDLMSLSPVSETKSLPNGMMSSGKLPVPCPPSQAAMPFAVPQGSYTYHYHEKLAAGTTQQVQLQLPFYIAGGQLYGKQIGHNTAGDAATRQQQQQQQLIWRTHLAHYMQNERQHNSSSPPLFAQPTSVSQLHGDYNPHDNPYQPFIFPVPLVSPSTLSTASKQKQIVAEGFR